MLANRPILVSALYSIQLLLVLRKHLVIGQFNFLLYFSLVTVGVVNLPERSQTGLTTWSDQTVWAVHGCNSWLQNNLKFEQADFPIQWQLKETDKMANSVDPDQTAPL